LTVDPTAAATNPKRDQHEPSGPALYERPWREAESRASGPGAPHADPTHSDSTAAATPVSQRTPPPSVQPPAVRVILALIGIDLMIMGFCVVLALINQPTLAGAAGTAALVVAGDIVRRFLNYLGRDDHQQPTGSSKLPPPKSPADGSRSDPASDIDRSPS
jgi:hypothetical protein